MNRTKIPWCDYTWNPIVGCSPISEGCKNCYAARTAKRFGLPWGGPKFLPERLDQPLKVKKPSMIFVCSTTDLGHEKAMDTWRYLIGNAMDRARWHRYIVLTKRPGLWLRAMPTPCWVGVTIESQNQINRWPTLDSTAWPASLKFVSIEPMLGPISFDAWPKDTYPEWVIAGPETGPGARPCNPEWIENLAAQSPCFFDKRDNWKRREFPV